MIIVDYVRCEFPEHDVTVVPDVTIDHDHALELGRSSVVAHVVGERRGAATARRMRRLAAPAHVVAVVVQPRPATVVRHSPEDTDGIFDLPSKRWISGAVVGALVATGAACLVCLLVGVPFVQVLVMSGFAAVLGGGLGFLLSGGARYAGERAWTQPQAPAQAVVVIAALVDDVARAERIAGALELAEPDSVRIVDREGRWRLPNSWDATELPPRLNGDPA